MRHIKELFSNNFTIFFHVERREIEIEEGSFCAQIEMMRDDIGTYVCQTSMKCKHIMRR